MLTATRARARETVRESNEKKKKLRTENVTRLISWLLKMKCLSITVYKLMSQKSRQHKLKPDYAGGEISTTLPGASFGIFCQYESFFDQYESSFGQYESSVLSYLALVLHLLNTGRDVVRLNAFHQRCYKLRGLGN